MTALYCARPGCGHITSFHALPASGSPPLTPLGVCFRGACRCPQFVAAKEA